MTQWPAIPVCHVTKMRWSVWHAIKPARIWMNTSAKVDDVIDCINIPLSTCHDTSARRENLTSTWAISIMESQFQSEQSPPFQWLFVSIETWEELVCTRSRVSVRNLFSIVLNTWVVASVQTLLLFWFRLFFIILMESVGWLSELLILYLKVITSDRFGSMETWILIGWFVFKQRYCY